MRTTGAIIALAVAGLLATGCGAARDAVDTISGARDALSDLREITSSQQPPAAEDVTDPPEWTDYPEVERRCGATWTRDEMIAAYEAHGLAGLPQRVGFSGTFASEIAEFHNRWRITRIIAAAQERRADAGLPPYELITCIAGTMAAEDPRDALGVNIIYINDHTEPLDTPTLVGVEIRLSVVTDDETTNEPQEPDAEMRWVGRCPRNVVLPPGGYTQTRCLLDGPGGLTSDHVDAPDGLPEDCPDPDLNCAGLAFTPSRDAFTEILADPEIDYTFNTTWRSVTSR